MLSIPGVLLANALGVSAQTATLGMDQDAERAIQHAIAAVLMAVLGVIFFAIARLRLRFWPATAVALVAALGSSVYSTLATALWSQTWAALLLGLLLLHLLRAVHGRAPARPWLLALLALGVFACRPAAITALVGVVMLAWPLGPRVRAETGKYLVAFAALAMLASLLCFGTLTPPSVYGRHQFGFAAPLTHLAGVLFSPGRGLLIYSPWIAVSLLVVVRFARPIAAWWPPWCALAAFSAQLALLSVFAMWWGSWSYGPRLFAEHAPWFALLASEAWAAWRSRPAPTVVAELAPRPARWLPALAAISAVAAIAIHVNGAYSLAARRWTGHMHIDETAGFDLWNWRYPQFATSLLFAGHVPTAALKASFPRELLVPEMRLGLDNTRYDIALIDGWARPQRGGRRASDASARLLLRFPAGMPICLELALTAPQRSGASLGIAIDDRPLAARALRPREQATLLLAVSADPLSRNRVLRIDSDAAAVAAGGVLVKSVFVLHAERCVNPAAD